MMLKQPCPHHRNVSHPVEAVVNKTYSCPVNIEVQQCPPRAYITIMVAPTHRPPLPPSTLCCRCPCTGAAAAVQHVCGPADDQVQRHLPLRKVLLPTEDGTTRWRSVCGPRQHDAVHALWVMQHASGCARLLFRLDAGLGCTACALQDALGAPPWGPNYGLRCPG